ncbi:MAG: PorT family protein [Paludibacteraceae bacterium]|nr:PorT family protein [Paludibacteraceae bacterium]
MKKVILSVIISVLGLSAYSVQVGDKVVLSNDASSFSTGERIPKWCKGQTFTVQQVGSKKFPNGIFLKEILSWVDGVDVGITPAKPATEESAKVEPVKAEPVIVESPAVQIVHTVCDTLVQIKRDTVIVKDTVFVAATATNTASTAADMATISERISATTVVANDSNTVAAENMPFNRFSVGVRGGLAGYFTDSKQLKTSLGYNALLDLQYSHYFKRKAESKPFCGILTGLSVGYNAAGVKSSISDQYTTVDAFGDRLDYNNTADEVKQTLGEVQIQVPLMFTLLYKGLFFNVGPRFVFPVYSHYKQTISNPHILAYYEPYEVPVLDNLYTGKVTDDQKETKGEWTNAVFKLYVSLEIGYEFALKSGNSLGLGVYADYCPYSTYKGTVTEKSIISISTVGENPQNPVPTVTVQPALNCYSTKLTGFDAGIKLVYNLNFNKK